MKNITALSILVFVLLYQQVCYVFATAPNTAKIVFTSNRDGNFDIYLMNPDGSNLVNLTRHPSSDATPIWSPTGEHIIFLSNRDGEWDLYIMDADGTNVKKVFENVASRRRPSWDPDGERIAYTRSGTIYIATRDGKDVQEVTSGIYPAWSPNGRWIAFILSPPGVDGKWGMGVFDLQTRTRKMVIDNPRRPFISHVRWSPDSSKLAFSWFNPEEFHLITVYTVNLDGSQLKRITKPPRGFWADSPVWSPHGNELLYELRGDANSQILKTRLWSRVSKKLTNKDRNYLGDWFDPKTLPVQTQAKLLTTLWGKLKRK